MNTRTWYAHLKGGPRLEKDATGVLRLAADSRARLATITELPTRGALLRYYNADGLAISAIEHPNTQAARAHIARCFPLHPAEWAPLDESHEDPIKHALRGARAPDSAKPPDPQ